MNERIEELAEQSKVHKVIKAIKVRVSGYRQFFRGRRSGETYHLPYTNRHPCTSFDKYPVNQRTLIGIWQNLHHYTCHSNRVMKKRWQSAANRFDANHLGERGGRRSTCRFLNEYTAHKWL